MDCVQEKMRIVGSRRIDEPPSAPRQIGRRPGRQAQPHTPCVTGKRRPASDGAVVRWYAPAATDTSAVASRVKVFGQRTESTYSLHVDRSLRDRVSRLGETRPRGRNFAAWNTYPTRAGKSRLVPLLASMGIMKTL